MTRDEVKKKLMFMLDDIIDAIMKNKMLEIRRDKEEIVQVYEIKRKNLKSNQ